MVDYIVSKQQMLENMHRDSVLFLSFYLGEELELDVPEFHIELWDEFLTLLDNINDPNHIVGILRKLLAVPRDHAKTTLVKLAVLLFLRYSKLRFCAYTSNTFGVALNAIRDIKDWLLSPQDSELYGTSVVKKSSESEGLYVISIMTPYSSKPKDVIMRAFGQGTQIRGMLIYNRRPDILIFDDVESHETADTAVQQSKLDRWCLGTAMKAMARNGICIFIGNVVRKTALLARLANNTAWNPTVFGAIIRNPQGELVPLWPGRWTLDTLLADYAEYRRLGQGHVWEAELMNLTADETLGESLENAIRPPQPVPDELAGGFLCLDPAFGQNAWNDESAITVHGLMHGGDIPILVDSKKGRYKTDQVFDEMLQMAMYWGIKTWAIETQAAQQLLIPYFRTLLVQRGMSADLLLLLPVLAGQKSKTSRIIAFRSAVAAGSYAVAENQQELLHLLEAYVPGTNEHDDLCDSAAYGLKVWEMYGSVIQHGSKYNVAGDMFAQGKTAGSMTAVDMGIP